MSDCTTRFTFPCPDTGVDIAGTFNHMTGRLDLTPVDTIDNIEPGARRETLAFCEEHEGNYFYLRDVRIALRDAGLNLNLIDEDEDDAEG
jgi:hypothetical protein